MKKSLLTFTFCLFTFSLLYAQWSTSPDSALQIGVGERTEIISDGEGGAFVVWYGFENVRVQKLDKYGYIQWTNITPQGGLDVGGSTSDSCWQITNTRHSALVADEEGGVYVMFDDVCCIANCDIWPQVISDALIQHFDSLGNWQWGRGLPVSIRNSYETATGTIVSDGAGGIIALYNERDSVGAPFTLRAQRFDAAGNRLWGNDGIIVKEPGGFTTAASDGVGGLIFTWSFSIQRINWQGQKMYGENGIEFATGGVEIEVDHENGYIYAQGGNYIGGSQNRIAVQKLALFDGTLQWDSLGVTIDTINTGAGGVSDFSVDSSGSVLISWYHFGGIRYIQKLSPSGERQFAIPGIPPSLYPSEKGQVQIQESNNGSFMAIWGDKRSGDWEIYGQKISSEGDYLWQDDIKISITSGGLSIATDSNYGAIINWWRLANFGIYVQQVSRNGNVGEVLTSVNSSGQSKLPDNFILNQNYPNPFNNSTIIKFQLSTLSDVELQIYNILGQKVKKLISEKRPPGFYRLEWGGNNDDGYPVSSGIYYYRLKVDDRSETRKMLLIR